MWFTWAGAPCQVGTSLCQIDRGWAASLFATFVAFGVQGAVGDINDIACMFQVKYEDEEENKDVTLYEDYRNNDLVVL